MGWRTSGDTKWDVIRDAYYDGTAQVSNNVRTFAIAGIGIIWLFKVTTKVQGVPYQLDNQLLWAAAFIMACLAVDLIQYLYKSIAWGQVMTGVYKSKASPDNSDEFKVWDHINKPASVAFFTKTVLLLIGYGIILDFLRKTISGT